MPIQPIEPGNVDQAKQLLADGFPARAPHTWTTYFDNLRALGANAAAGVPFGYLMTDGDRPTGVMLTPASSRIAPDGRSALVVNLSSWYVEPAHRWRAPLMLQTVLRKHHAMFTDLTPTEEVRKLLPSFGFVPVNRGVVITPVPIAAAGRAPGASVRDLGPSEIPDLPGNIRDLLEAHRAVGCLLAVLKTRNGTIPLMFRPRKLKGLPAAKLVYCENLAELHDHLPAVARYLALNGILLLIYDDLSLKRRPGQMLRARGLKFARPGADLAPQPGRIDYAGSELSLMDF